MIWETLISCLLESLMMLYIQFLIHRVQKKIKKNYNFFFFALCD